MHENDVSLSIIIEIHFSSGAKTFFIIFTLLNPLCWLIINDKLTIYLYKLIVSFLWRIYISREQLLIKARNVLPQLSINWNEWRQKEFSLSRNFHSFPSFRWGKHRWDLLIQRYCGISVVQSLHGSQINRNAAKRKTKIRLQFYGDLSRCYIFIRAWHSIAKAELNKNICSSKLMPLNVSIMVKDIMSEILEKM